MALEDGCQNCTFNLKTRYGKTLNVEMLSWENEERETDFISQVDASGLYLIQADKASDEFKALCEKQVEAENEE